MTTKKDDHTPEPEVEAVATEVEPTPDQPVFEVDAVGPRTERGDVVVKGTVKAQVTGPPQTPQHNIKPREAIRHTDVVITDPSSPLAVQPLAPRDDLPGLGDSRTPEEKLAAGE